MNAAGQTWRKARIGVAALLAGLTAGAATYTWDTTPGTPGMQDGSGNWDTATANWYDGTNHTWNNAGNDTAVLHNPQGGPRGYVVTINNEPITIGGLQFTGSYNAYTLAASGVGVLNLGLASTPASSTVQSFITAPVGGTGGLTTSGAGTLYLTSANSYSGATVVNSDLRLRHSSALGTADGGTTINAGGQVIFDNTFTNAGAVVDAFTLNGGTLANNAGSTVVCSGQVTVQATSRVSQLNFGGRQMTFSGGIVNNGVTLNLTVDSGGTATYNINSGLSGSGTVNFGNCTVNLNTANSFAGVYSASNSNVCAMVAGALGAAPLTLTDASVLRVQNNVNPGSGQITLNNGTIWAFQNSMTLYNPIALTGPGTIMSHSFGSDATLRDSTIGLGGNTLTLVNATYPGFIGSGNIHVYDQITGNGNVSLGNGVDNGAIWLYNTSNSYTGSTTIPSGRVVVQANGVIPANSDVVVNSTNAQALYVLNTPLTIGSLSGTGYVNTATSGALSVGNNHNSTVFNGQITGSGSLTKIGNGTLTLAGSNSYTGATTVSVGKLLVNGTITSNTTVASGATLGGSGVVTRNVVIDAGGWLAPGNSPGILTVNGNLTENGTLEIELGAYADPNSPPSFDQIVGVDDLALGANSALEVSPWNRWTGRTWYPIIEYSGDLTGAFGTVSSRVIAIDYAHAFGAGTWVAIQVPEPATVALLGLAGLLMRRRR